MYYKNLEANQVRVGECFGEVAIVGNCAKGMKMHSKYCYMAREDCELLCIPYSKIKELLLKAGKDDFLTRVGQLMETKYVRSLNPYAVALLSVVGEVKLYSYGNVVLAQNAVPRNFYCVMQGECKSIYDKILTRSEEIVESRVRNSKSRSRLLPKLDNKESRRSFDNEKIKVLQLKSNQHHKHISYRTHVNY